MGSKPNWGAGLQALGQGIGDYAEIKRREMAMKMLREQQVADLADQRAYDDQKWLDRLNITDPFVNVPGDVQKHFGMEPTQTIPGSFPIPEMAIPQRERTSVVKDWQGMLPRQERQAAPSITWKDPVTGTDVTTSYEDYLQYTRPDKKADSGSGGYYVTDGTGEPVFYENSPSMLDGQLSPAGALNGLPLLNYDGSAAAGGGKAPGVGDVKTASTELATRALGPLVNKVTAKGDNFYFGQGGNRASGGDQANFMRPELWQDFAGAAADSFRTGRWPVGSPTDALSQNVWSDVADKYIADITLPGSWEFRGGDTPDKGDDRFVNPKKARRDDSKKPIDFFKENILPVVNEAKDPEVAWKSLVVSAGKYGLDPNELLPLLNKDKFAFLLGAANASATEDKIKSIFGDK